MPCKEEEDKVNVSKMNNVKQVQHDEWKPIAISQWPIAKKVTWS